jgi:hypothetical protein
MLNWNLKKFEIIKHTHIWNNTKTTTKKSTKWKKNLVKKTWKNCVIAKKLGNFTPTHM